MIALIRIGVDIEIDSDPDTDPDNAFRAASSGSYKQASYSAGDSMTQGAAVNV